MSAEKNKRKSHVSGKRSIISSDLKYSQATFELARFGPSSVAGSIVLVVPTRLLITRKEQESQREKEKHQQGQRKSK